MTLKSKILTLPSLFKSQAVVVFPQLESKTLRSKMFTLLSALQSPFMGEAEGDGDGDGEGELPPGEGEGEGDGGELTLKATWLSVVFLLSRLSAHRT